MKRRCARRACKKLLKAYSPPNRDVPKKWGDDDPYCSRECCEKDHKVWTELKRTEWV